MILNSSGNAEKLIDYASKFKPINYPPYQPPMSTDILTSLALSGTSHADNQPSHLRLPEGSHVRAEHVKANVSQYAALLERACPAGVYEYVDSDGKEGTEEGGGWGGKKLVIKAQVRLS